MVKQKFTAELTVLDQRSQLTVKTASECVKTASLNMVLTMLFPETCSYTAPICTLHSKKKKMVIRLSP